MKDLIEKESLKHLFTPPSPGEVVRGRVIGKQKSALFLDLGTFGAGVVSGREFNGAKQLVKEIKIGDDLTAKVVGLSGDDGYLQLSISDAQKEIAWDKLKERKKDNESFMATVAKANKGGLMMMAENVSGFLPVSQLKPEHYPKVEDGDQAKILQKLQKFIGMELKVVVLTIDPKQKTLILSEKEADLEKTKETLKNYHVNDIVKGKVTGVVDFGAFIKFPLENETEEGKTIEGLIHISELDWQLIQDPLDVVKVGDEVEAKIIDISNGRVSLSLKALKKDPWESIKEKYKKDDVISGTVTKFNPFGAFVQIEPKIQGLIHISEFKSEEEMKNTLQLDKEYQFKIVTIEPKEHRMILNLVKDGEKKN
jgi:small subunit ribosomal protein S1